MTCEPERPAPPAAVWATARADYLAGCSAPVVAERHGLSERTVRRRAGVEGWRRADAKPSEPNLSSFCEPAAWPREKGLEDYPELETVEEATLAARFQLIDPDQQNLRRYAFRQAAEAAAMSRPAEAVVWMRLVQTLERTCDRIDREAGRFREQDYIRAACLQAVATPDPSRRED